MRLALCMKEQCVEQGNNGDDAERFLPREPARDDLLVDEPCRNRGRGERNQRPPAARYEQRAERGGDNAHRICRRQRHARAREQGSNEDERERGDEGKRKHRAARAQHLIFVAAHYRSPSLSAVV